jgi:hypothetical protein
MAKTVADPRVLQATNQPNMLQNLQVFQFKQNKSFLKILVQSPSSVIFFLNCGLKVLAGKKIITG